jgi:hypothetical protein
MAFGRRPQGDGMDQLKKIDHIVVLMLENRSFDTLLGKLYPNSNSFEGLAGNEQNPDANGAPIAVWNSPAPMKPPCGSQIPIPVSYGPTSTRSYSATPPPHLVRRRA